MELTVGAVVPGQPLSFGTVGGSDDADVVSTFDGQIVLASLGGHGNRRLVHGIFLSGDLTNTNGRLISGESTTLLMVPLVTADWDWEEWKQPPLRLICCRRVNLTDDGRRLRNFPSVNLLCCAAAMMSTLRITSTFLVV